MGTVAAVQWKGETDVKALVEMVQQTFREIETLLNAHNPESELSRLAPLSNDEILKQCSPLVAPCYREAFFWQNLTGNVFNPRWKGAGTMDLGGIAKGYALDEAARRILRLRMILPDLLIDLGGSLSVVKGTWTIGIAGLPQQLTLTAGQSCATSAEYYRGKHIADGRTGEPVQATVKSVTVVTLPGQASALQADALSTTLFILGETAGNAFLQQQDTARFVQVYYAGF